MKKKSDSDDHFLEARDHLFKSMAAAHREIARRIDIMNSQYVSTERDNLFTRLFDNMVINAAAGFLGHAAKPRIAIVVGASGSGKSASIQHHIANRPEFQPYSRSDGVMVSSMLSLDAPVPATQLTTARKGIKSFKLPIASKLSPNEASEIFCDLLKANNKMFVHIDEMQFAVRGNGRQNVITMQDFMRTLIQTDEHVLHLLLSGAEKLFEFVGEELQWDNRSEMVLPLLDLSFERHKKLLESIMRIVVEDHAGLKRHDLSSDDLLKRVLHAARYQYGTYIQWIRAACTNVFYDGRDTVTPEDFAKAYGLAKGCIREKNVFLSADWLSIVPSKPPKPRGASGRSLPREKERL